MQIKSTMTYSELIPCFEKKVRYKNTIAVTSGISLFMSALIGKILSIDLCSQYRISESLTMKQNILKKYVTIVLINNNW